MQKIDENKNILKVRFMKKFIIILIVLLTLNILNAERKNQLARLHYDGGGDWYNDPDTLPNFVDFINRNIHTNFSNEQAVVRPSDNRIFDYPFIYLTGHGNISFSERDVANLREYLFRGGFLYADDDYGMDTAFRREIKKVFPELEMIELPHDHEIFHSYYSLPEGLPKVHEHDGKRPQTFGIFTEYGRLMVLYTYESNPTDAWTDAHAVSSDLREKAFQFGANIIYYLINN